MTLSSIKFKEKARKAGFVGLVLAIFAIIWTPSALAEPEDIVVPPDTDLIDQLYVATSIKLSLYSSDLESYVVGLPGDLATAERNLGQVQAQFDQQPPMLWLKMSFDRENTLRSKLSGLFS